MMALEKIEVEDMLPQEAFLVETRSLPGYSGSAVFLYSANAMMDMSIRRFGGPKMTEFVPSKIVTPEGWAELERGLRGATSPKGPYLLGVDFCHIKRKVHVLDANGKPVPEKYFVIENTGMAGVKPAWKIADILNSEGFVAGRQKVEKEMRESALTRPHV